MRNAAIYNPHNKQVHELIKIYGFPNIRYRNTYKGSLLSRDGDFLHEALATDEETLAERLGIYDASLDIHKELRRTFHNGYVMEYVPFTSREVHRGLNLAYANHLSSTKNTWSIK